MSAGRLSAAGICFGICVLFGKVRITRSRQQVEELEKLLGDLRSAENSVRLVRLPLGEIVNGLRENGRSKKLWSSVCAGMSSGLDFGRSVASADTPPVSPEAEKIFSELSSLAVSNDADVLAKRLSSVADRLENELETERKNSREKEKLTSSLSVFAGLAAALLIL